MPKKSFQKLNVQHRRQLAECGSRPFVVFAVVELQFGDSVPNMPGLDISTPDSANIPERVVPDPARGTWARRNIDGWDITRKDLGKTTKTYSVESPNFGDWSKGTHEVSWDREVYEHDVFAGFRASIGIQELRRSATTITLAFEFEHVFEAAPSDERVLLFAINIVQESVGHSALRPTDRSAQDYRRSVQVSWEVLPVGQRDEVLRQVRERLDPSPEEDRVIEDRMDLLLGLRPRNLVTGTSGFMRYVGAQFGDELVVFENVRYGNAIYVMFEDWERLSRLTRIELQNSGENYERIIHIGNWKRRLRAVVREYRN